jgi:long-chain acyl-CoA synthetase
MLASINAALERVNKRLAHAEQVKQWAILPNDLTIDCGDLTASLKLKRREVNERFAPVIDTLYGDGPAPSEGILHITSGKE